jgi:acetyl-CoA C-acetyltransferase
MYATTYDDVWLVDGARTGLADYGGTLRDVSPTDLGIAVARAALDRSCVPGAEIDTVIGANCAQSSFDAYYLPRHVGLYAGVPIETPALLVHRLCASGFEAIMQGADHVMLGRGRTALCFGAESMSRTPIAAYTHRAGFRLGQVEFKDFLWESLTDPAPGTPMGQTAENLARRYGISREDVDAFAAESFARAVAAKESGFHAGEIVPLSDAVFEREGFRPRRLSLPRGAGGFAEDEHVRPTPRETLAKLKPVFGGVQTGGNSSAIVDGAAGVVVASGEFVRANGLRPLARVVAGAVAGVPPEVMGIGPAPAIRALLAKADLPQDRVDRFEINEAFGAQYVAVERELGLDRARVNVNGGAIAIGHPLGATGVRCTLTLARELRRGGVRYGVSSACAGGGQGIAVLLEAA